MLRYDSDWALREASAKTLKCWQQMDEYYVVDSCGQRHNLVDPELIEPPRGLGMLLWIMTGTKRPVRWSYEVGEVLSVDQIQALIFANFHEHENVWQAYDLEELKQRVAAAQSVKEIMAVFD